MQHVPQGQFCMLPYETQLAVQACYIIQWVCRNQASSSTDLMICQASGRTATRTSIFDWYEFCTYHTHMHHCPLPFYTTFFGWRSQGQQEGKPIGIVASNTSRLISMKCDVVLNNLNSITLSHGTFSLIHSCVMLIGLDSCWFYCIQLTFKEERAGDDFFLKRYHKCWLAYECLWTEVIFETWCNNRRYQTLEFDVFIEGHRVMRKLELLHLFCCTVLCDSCISWNTGG